jgi:glycosyltransferase involved in cell wall biosynthesis
MAALVSVIIPTFNRAHLLPGSVRTVLAQTHRPLQLIIVNDGSSDDTLAVLNALETEARAAGVETAFVTQANTGPSAARNAGLDRARGEYIAFLDDDDVWFPQKLERQLKALEVSGADACSCLTLNSKTGETVPKHVEDLFIGHNPAAYVRGELDCHIISIVFSSKLLPKVGEFDPVLKSSVDSEWKLRLVHEVNFCAIPEVLAAFCRTPGSVSEFTGYAGLIQRDRRWEQVLLLARERCAGRPGWDEENWRHVAARAFAQYVKHYLYGGEVAKALETYKRGLALTGGAQPLPGVRRKMFKARLMGWFGRRIKHPKLANIEDFRV